MFDSGEFDGFIADKILVSLKHYFFEYDGLPRIALVAHYRLSALCKDKNKKGGQAPGRGEDWKKLLDDDSMPLFDTLRQWRNERGKSDGVPPYIVLTNKQLAEICNKKPRSHAGLMELESVGKGKVERYGDEILKYIPCPADKGSDG